MTVTLVDTKAALITKQKANTAILALLTDPLEIREVEWQGTEFSYPNIRVRIDQFKRNTPNSACNMFDVQASIYVFAEDASSLLCDQIASEIFNQLDTKSFSVGIVKLTGIKATQHGAMWVEESGAWRSEINLTFQVS